MKDFITCIFVCIVCITFLAFLVFWGYFMDKIECNTKANAIGYKSEYHYFTGCVLEKPNGKKVLLRQLRDYND